MGSPTNRLGLLIDTKTVGDASVEKLADSLNKVVSISERSGRSVQKMGSDFSRVGPQIQQGLTNPIASAQAGMTSFLGTMGKVGGVIGTVVIGLGTLTAASFKLVSELGAASDQMLDFSARTGLALGEVDKLQAMSRIAGVNLQSLEQSAVRLGQAISGVGGEGVRARKALEELNVEVVDAEGNLRDQGQVLLDTIRALSQMEDRSLQLALANEVLGESAREIIPLIRSYEELREQVREFGTTEQVALIEGIDESRMAMERLRNSWVLLKRELAVPATAVVNFVASTVQSLATNPVAAFGGQTGPTSVSVQAAQGRSSAALLGNAPLNAALQRFSPVPPAWALTGLTSGQPSAAQARLEAVRSSFLNSPEGLRLQLSQAQGQLGGLNTRLASGGTLSSAELDQRAQLIAAIRSLTAQLAGPTQGSAVAGLPGNRPVALPSNRSLLGFGPGISPVPFAGVGPAQINPAITGPPALDPRVQDLIRLREEGIQMAIDKEKELADARLQSVEEFRFAVEDAFNSFIYGGAAGLKRYLQTQFIRTAGSFISGQASRVLGGGSTTPGGVFQGASSIFSPIFSAFGGGGGGGGANPPLIEALNKTQLAVPGFGGGLLSSIGAIGGALSSALPFVGLGVAGLSLVTSLFGNGKQQRAEELAINIESARINVNGPTQFRMASGGGEVDSDFRGGVRRIPDEDIADAVQRSIQRGHPINESMREAVLVA